MHLRHDRGKHGWRAQAETPTCIAPDLDRPRLGSPPTWIDPDLDRPLLGSPPTCVAIKWRRAAHRWNRCAARRHHD